MFTIVLRSQISRRGVVALSADLICDRRGVIDRLLMAGTNGQKMPGIRAHLKQAIGDKYREMDTTIECFPDDSVERDVLAYREGLSQLVPGDVVTVFHT